jgi:hypothetical protein
MRCRPRRITALALVLCLLLTGCAGRSHSEKASFLKLRAAWLEAGTVDLRARVRADYGDRVYDFLLRYRGSGEGGVLTVEEPWLLQNVEAELGKEGVLLRYDGVMLDTGAILGNLSPLEAFPLLLRAWQSAAVTDCRRETWEGSPCLRAELDLTPPGEAETRTCVSWFRLPDGKPLHAELLSAGRSVLFCDFPLEEPPEA